MDKFLTFDEYQTMGGTLDETKFDRIEYRSEKIILSRIHQNIEIDEDLKRCMYELIEYLNKSVSNGAISNIKSVTNDGYSMTMNVSSNKKQYDDLYGINGIINTYLYKYIRSRGVSYV